MPEQIVLARKRLLAAQFLVQDAADMRDVSSASRDTVVVFGVLHHIPEWTATVDEIAHVLRHGGEVYLEEPDGGVIQRFDRRFKWGHPVTLRFKELEAHLLKGGFVLVRQSY
jgi:SAM-dependent methyltransferase